MAYLTLSEDEIALLRYTCDLAFVEESPLYGFERHAREPSDYASAYRSLVAKEVIDPYEFRITDAALNRLAPVTECDGRLVAIRQGPGEMPTESSFWLLDEISVELVEGEEGYAFGRDLDPMEMVEQAARRLVPRKSGGDRLALQLTSAELLVLGVLARSSFSAHGFVMRENEARARLGQEDLSDHTLVTRPSALSAVGVRAYEPPGKGGENADAISMSISEIDHAFAGLIRKRAIELRDGLIRPLPSTSTLLDGMRNGVRHTWVRLDFGEDQWLLRETTLFEAAGSLISLKLDDEGLARVEEVDGDRLRRVLAQAVGPLTRAHDSRAPRPLRDLLLGGRMPPSPAE